MCKNMHMLKSGFFISFCFPATSHVMIAAVSAVVLQLTDINDVIYYFSSVIRQAFIVQFDV